MVFGEIISAMAYRQKMPIKNTDKKAAIKNGDKKVTKKTQMQYDKILVFMEVGKSIELQ